MATYDELADASSNGTLRNRVQVACFIAAEAIRNESAGTANHLARLLWAKRVFEDPSREGLRMLYAVLAANSGVAIASIIGASDASIQTAVNNAVNIFAQ